MEETSTDDHDGQWQGAIEGDYYYGGLYDNTDGRNRQLAALHSFSQKERAYRRRIIGQQPTSVSQVLDRLTQRNLSYTLDDFFKFSHMIQVHLPPKDFMYKALLITVNEIKSHRRGGGRLREGHERRLRPLLTIYSHSNDVQKSLEALYISHITSSLDPCDYKLKRNVILYPTTEFHSNNEQQDDLCDCLMKLVLNPIIPTKIPALDISDVDWSNYHSLVSYLKSYAEIKKDDSRVGLNCPPVEYFQKFTSLSARKKALSEWKRFTDKQQKQKIQELLPKLISTAPLMIPPQSSLEPKLMQQKERRRIGTIATNVRDTKDFLRNSKRSDVIKKLYNLQWHASIPNHPKWPSIHCGLVIVDNVIEPKKGSGGSRKVRMTDLSNEKLVTVVAYTQNNYTCIIDAVREGIFSQCEAIRSKYEVTYMTEKNELSKRSESNNASLSIDEKLERLGLDCVILK